VAIKRDGDGAAKIQRRRDWSVNEFVDEIRQRRRLQNRAPVMHWGVYVGTQGLTAYTHLSDHK